MIISLILSTLIDRPTDDRVYRGVEFIPRNILSSLKTLLPFAKFPEMELCIDAGNTRTKLAVFRNNEIVYRRVYRSVRVSDLRSLFLRFEIQTSIISSVRKTPAAIVRYLRSRGKLIQLGSRTILPLKNRYQTPETLGNDRLAIAAGIAKLFKGKNVLAIDLGTCIKYDFVNSRNEYLGGSISPGLTMRFRALHKYTSRLPLITPDATRSFIGRSTRESILTGVQNGILNEVKGFIGSYKKEYGSVKVVLSGGDADRFAGQLKLPIFAASDLVLTGLHEILLKNVPQ